jgi:hypothetical protein
MSLLLWFSVSAVVLAYNWVAKSSDEKEKLFQRFLKNKQFSSAVIQSTADRLTIPNVKRLACFYFEGFIFIFCIFLYFFFFIVFLCLPLFVSFKKDMGVWEGKRSFCSFRYNVKQIKHF